MTKVKCIFCDEMLKELKDKRQVCYSCEKIFVQCPDCENMVRDSKAIEFLTCKSCGCEFDREDVIEKDTGLLKSIDAKTWDKYFHGGIPKNQNDPNM